MDLPAGRAAGVPGDGGVRGPGRARRVHGAAGRRRRRAGRHLAAADPRDHLAVGVPRGHGQLHARRPARQGVPGAPRPSFPDHRGAPEAGGGLLRAPRRQDDPDRPLHRAGPSPGAVHRRDLEHGLSGVLALQRARHRALGGDLHPDRLLRLAEPGRGRGDRQQGADLFRRLRRHRGRDHRRDPLPAPAREPPQAGRGDGAPALAAAGPRLRQAASAPGPLPVAAADARGAGSGVHDADGGPVRGAVRADRLLVDRRGRSRADARRRRPPTTSPTTSAPGGSTTWPRWSPSSARSTSWARWR